MPSTIASASAPQAAAVTTPAVALDRVSCLFGDFVALRDVTLQLPAGASVVLLGENGAGKSTLLRLIAGLATPTFGTVTVFGQAPDAHRGRIAYMGHASMLYDELTALENLLYFYGLHTSSLASSAPRRQCELALQQVGLDPSNTRRVGDYSQGMRQRASLARVLLTNPDVLLLDEPFANLDAASAHSMVTRLLSWSNEANEPRKPRDPGAYDRPRTLLLTTHQAELARPLAQLTLHLEAGHLQPFNPPVAGSVSS